MNKKLIIYGIISTLGVNFFCWGEDSVSGSKTLSEKSLVIQRDIDELINQAHELTSGIPKKEKTAEAPLNSKVVMPEEITKDSIVPQNSEKKMSLEFDNANLEDVLRTIGEAGGFNIILDPNLKGRKVNLHLKEIIIEEAMKLIYSAYDLSSFQIGSSLFVSTKEKIKTDRIINKLVKVENVSVEEAKRLIDKLVDIVNVSDEINTLVIVGVPEDVAKAESILKKIDRPMPQVILEAKIIEIGSDVKKELGIDWSDAMNLGFQEGKRPMSLGEQGPDVFGSAFRIFKLARTGVNFETVIKMLEENNKAKILSNPRVATLNNKEAEIFVGDRVPYTITSVTGGVASTEVRFVEPGIRLRITPSVIEKNFVVIKIQPEVSYIYGWRGPDNQYPWVRTREATAYVRVENNQPFVLGGLLSKEDENNLYQVPFLGNIPLLGNLFKYNKSVKKDSELIITVTPTIVSGGI